MNDIYIDIREQNDDIRELFSNKDFVSIDAVLDIIDDLNYQINSMKEELEDLKKDKWEREEDKRGYYADMYYELEKLSIKNELDKSGE